MDIYGGITYERLESGGLQWPCLAADMADTPMLYASSSEDRKPRLSPMKLSLPPAHVDAEYPFLLAMGRVLHEADRTMEIGQESKRNFIERKEVLELHEEDARALGVSKGDQITAVSARKRLHGIVSISSPHRGLISTTALFGQIVTELDRSKDPDPMLKVEGLPLVPVRIELAAEAAAD